MNFIEVSRQLIAIDSSPAAGTCEAAQFVGDLCSKLGMDVDYQQEALDGVMNCNLIAKFGTANGAGEFLLQSFLDTQDPGPFALWTKTAQNPFNATIIGDEIYGLGATSKLDILCKLQALSEVSEEKRSEMPLALVATFGRFNGMEGAKKLLRRKRVSPKLALVGSPTDLSVCGAGPGYMVFECEVPFSSEEKDYQNDHDLMESSSTQAKFFKSNGKENINPIEQLLNYLEMLPEGIALMDVDGGAGYGSLPASVYLEVDMVDVLKEGIVSKIVKINKILNSYREIFSKHKDVRFDPEFSTIHLGRIKKHKGGIVISGVCNLLPNLDRSHYEKWINELAEQMNDIGALFKIVDYKQPFCLPEKSNLISLVEDVSSEAEMGLKIRDLNQASEASVFSRLGAECLVFGAGRPAFAYGNPNECISISAVRKATKFYSKLLNRVVI